MGRKLLDALAEPFRQAGPEATSMRAIAHKDARLGGVIVAKFRPFAPYCGVLFPCQIRTTRLPEFASKIAASLV